MRSSPKSTVSISPTGEAVARTRATAPLQWRYTLDAVKSTRKWQDELWHRWPRYEDWPGHLDLYESAAYLRVCPKFLRQRLCAVENKNGSHLSELPHNRVGWVYRIKIHDLEQYGAIGDWRQNETQAPSAVHSGNWNQSQSERSRYWTAAPRANNTERLSEDARKSTKEWQISRWKRWRREQDWPGYLDVYEAAAFLRVSPKSIRRKLRVVKGWRTAAEPTLPHNHLGRIFRIRKDRLQREGAVDSWIKRSA